MRYKLKNNLLEAVIDTKGAELKSLIYKGEELMLTNEVYWNYTSPFLFPVIGALKDGFTIINEKEYKIPKHGLIRTSDFALEEENPKFLRFSFTSPEEMLEIYPYKFKFTVTYFLEKSTLTTTIKVLNLSAEKMHFNLGLHPAFSTIAFKKQFKDYSVKFEKKENAKLPVIEKDGTLNFSKELKAFYNLGLLPLQYQDYATDALVFKNLKSRKVSLINDAYIIDFNYPAFSSLGIWTKPESPFICLEPWIGHGDKHDSNHDFFTKDDLVSLMPDKTKTFEFSFTIKKPEIEE